MSAAPELPKQPSPITILHGVVTDVIRGVQKDDEEPDFDLVEEKLTHRLMRDARIRRAMVGFTVQMLMSDIRRKDRQNIEAGRPLVSEGAGWRNEQQQATGPAPGNDRGLAFLAAKFEQDRERFSKWPLRSGVLLAKATVAEVEEEAAYYRAIGKNAMKNAQWFGSIVERARQAEIADGAPIGDVVSELVLTELHDEAVKTWSE